MIDNGSYTACRFAVLIGKEAVGFAIFECGILLFVEGVEFVSGECRNPIWIVFIECKREFYEFAQIAS